MWDNFLKIISPEEAIARIRDHKIIHKMDEPRAIYISKSLDMAIEALEQETKTGHWIEVDTNMYACSNCSHCFSIVPEDNSIKQYHYCPNCKTRMFEPQESEG